MEPNNEPSSSTASCIFDAHLLSDCIDSSTCVARYIAIGSKSRSLIGSMTNRAKGAMPPITTVIPSTM